MAYVVTKPCLGTKDKSCIEVCPVDCFYDIRKPEINEKYGVSFDDSGEEDEKGKVNAGMLMIHPDECINCGACETECPVEAIYEDTAVPDENVEFVQLNEQETMSLSEDDLEKFRCLG